MDSGFLPPSTITGEALLPVEKSMLRTPCQSEKGGSILLHLLEFRTHLLEAVEELHIRRDAETQFENQIGKVVLEKQEMEWEKESLQHQITTATKQHAESLITIEKQLQIKIRSTEEEKGKFQVISELKEKEISNLKEELKALQLLKYNFEKKANELEQKQALQSRSKDSHLIQMGEVEKRFDALARQCATLKKAHTQLEENVDEVMKRNKKLTATNEKHEATIQALMKELEEVNTKLIQTKLSSVQHDNTYAVMTQTKQHLSQLSYKLGMEKIMNKKLREENTVVSSEKQEVIMSLQYTQQLFLNQVHAVNRLEQQLLTQEEQCKFLEQVHEEMQEKTKSMKEKITQLMRVEKEFQALKEVHDDLQQKHNELTAQVKVQAHTINELEMFPSLTEGTRGRPPDEPKSSSTLSFFGSQQNSAISQNKILDCLEDTRANTKLDGEMGGQGTPQLHETFEAQLQVQCKKSLSIQSPQRLLGLSETMENNNTLLNKERSSYSEVSNVTCATIHQSVNDITISEILVDGLNTPSSDMSSNDLQANDRRQGDGSTSQNESDNTGMNEVEGTSDKTDEGSTNKRQSRKTEDDLEEICVGEEEVIRTSQPGNRGNIQENNSLCTQESKKETATNCRNGGKEEGKTETEMEAQTSCNFKSNTSSDIDFMVISEKIGTVCEADCYQNVTEKVADQSLVNMTEGQLLQDISCPANQSPDDRDISLVEDAQRSCQFEVQTNAETVKPSPTVGHPVIEKTKEVKLDESIATVQTKFSDLLKQPADSVTNPTMAETTNFKEVKKTIVDAGIESDNQGVQELSNEVMDIFESNACKEVYGMASQTKSVTCDGDLKTSISNPENGESSKKFENVSSGSIQPKNGLVETLENGTACLEQPVVKETLCDAEELPALPVLKTHQPSVDWGGSQQTVLSLANSILQPNVQNSTVSEQNASNALCSTQLSKEHLMIIRASELLKVSNASASTEFGRKHKLKDWNIFGKNFRETAATYKGKASLSVPTCPVSSASSTWPTPSGTSVPDVASKSDIEFKPQCSQEEEQSSIRAQISKIEQFLQTERLHFFKRRRTEN
ncbi:coiled-coil domain-containing protein 73-like isoform X2 [Corythoichthys intestinalis]|uniref:coiled-coil domain-containing protein 73-like isoform X2 n=1 Tax=Corythoichthys intestinalis TaxID=161448 RepID=UPI0025A63264|nr:coiled-coil domain-containing protein 73-like isoform X2 [Corythoichthys intestinalis]